MSPAEKSIQNQEEEHKRRLRVAEITLGETATKVRAVRVPVADRGPYGADYVQSFEGLGVDAYAGFLGE